MQCVIQNTRKTFVKSKYSVILPKYIGPYFYVLFLECTSVLCGHDHIMWFNKEHFSLTNSPEDWKMKTYSTVIVIPYSSTMLYSQTVILERFHFRSVNHQMLHLPNDRLDSFHISQHCYCMPFPVSNQDS